MSWVDRVVSGPHGGRFIAALLLVSWGLVFILIFLLILFKNGGQ